MAPFKILTDAVEGDKYETLLMVWPINLKLHKLLAQDNEFDEGTVFVKKMKKIGRDYMQENARDFRPTFLHRAATVLHPEMRKLLDFSSLDREEIYQEIENHIPSISNQSASNQSDSSQGT